MCKIQKFRGMPQDVKCHETCHVYSDSCGLMAKHRETTHSHDEQVSVAPCSYFSIAYSYMVEFVTRHIGLQTYLRIS